jgi:hypothetical protein
MGVEVTQSPALRVITTKTIDIYVMLRYGCPKGDLT